MRHLIRMLEFRNRRCANEISEGSRRDLQCLEAKVHRSPHYDASLSLTENILQTAHELQECRTLENKRKLGAWRTKMKSDQHAYRWLGKQTVTLNHAIKISDQDSIAESPQQALCKLKDYWNQIWRRPQINFEAVWHQVESRLPHNSQTLSFAPLSKEDLRKAATSCRATAAGLDGWRPEEVLCFSDEMFLELVEFYHRCEGIGQVPRAWRSLRQIHLSKGKKPGKDGASLAADLRPVSISSLFWRLYTKARFQRPKTQAWIKQILPENVYGGVPGKGIQDAAGQLLKAAHEGCFIASLDLENAFDSTSPKLAICIMKRLGLCERLAALLLDVWEGQDRHLQLLGEKLPGGVLVKDSLPQGDSWSMLAVTAVLLPAIQDIMNRFPSIDQINFADDRTFASQSPAELRQVMAAWASWAHTLGLKENSGKAQIFHATVRGRRRLVSVGFDPDTVRGSIRVLGYTFSPAQGRRVDNHEKARLLESKVRASRCSCLPGTMKRKVTIAQRAVVPKASWGWLFRRPSKVDVKEVEAVFRRLHKKQKLASPHLFSVVRGHRWDLRFMAVNELVAVLHRNIANGPQPSKLQIGQVRVDWSA